ncbi:hypothetical protein ACB092_05G008100 [Castanea dentata]
MAIYLSWFQSLGICCQCCHIGKKPLKMLPCTQGKKHHPSLAPFNHSLNGDFGLGLCFSALLVVCPHHFSSTVYLEDQSSLTYKTFGYYSRRTTELN